MGGWWVVVGDGAYFLVKFRLLSKSFRSCYKIVWELFLDLEGPYLRAISARIFFHDHQNRDFKLKFWPILQGIETDSPLGL